MTTLIPKYDQGSTGAVNRPINQKLSEVISVKDFGAVGDGSTDDTAAIQAALAAIKANGGGTLYFPKSTGAYYVARVVDPNVIQAASVFKLASNTYVEFDQGCQIVYNGSSNATVSNAVMGLFGVDWTALPVKNIGFINCNFVQSRPLASATDNMSAIQLAVPTDSPNGSIQNVHIESCNFDYCYIYITQRITNTNSSLYGDRQTQNVIITNCIAINNASQFVTVDGNSITVANCIASGIPGDTTESYEAISCHCGFNINIVDNIFSNYHVGSVINVRDDTNTGCGSKNINIIGNTIHDCTAPQAIQLSTSGSPTANQGLFNITISSNTIYDCVSAINIIRTGTGALGQISITGNIITADSYGIFCNQAIANSVQDLLISNNDIHMTSSGGFALSILGLTFGSITGNNFISDSVSSSYQLVYIAGCSVVSVTGNSMFTSATNSAGVVQIGDTGKTVNQFSFVGNTVYCSSNFSNFGSFCKVLDNNFAANATINGNVLGTTKVSYADSNVTWTNNIAPTTGTWSQSDITYNSNPTAGGTPGWVCTTSGTPGTWKAMANLAA